MKRLLISLISVVSFLETFPQPGNIADQFIEAYRAARREIIHITLPNSFYLQGERVPLYAHLVDGVTQRASNISEIAHIEVVNEAGQVMQSMSFQLEEGKFTGYLSIADSIPDGHYMIQSYTDWMKNFTPKSFFRAPIQIGSSPLPSESTTKVVKFYPEGGTWLSGVPNTILLEATYKPYDTPLRTGGYIIKDQLDTVAEISTNDAGLAVFQLIPETGSVYIYVDGNDRYPLDDFKENGAKLAVQELSSFVIVSAFYDSKIAGNDSYKIFMHLRGRPVFESEPLKGSQQKITFNKSNLNAGLYEVLLVGSKNEILSKRLFYIDMPSAPTARLEKDQLKNRETTEIVVAAGSPLNGLLLVDKRNAYSSTLPLYLSINSFLDKPITREIFENRKYIDYNLIGREQVLLDMQSLIRGAAPKIEHSARKDFVLSGTLYNNANEPLANKDIKIISVNSGLNFSGSTNESGQFRLKIISILRDQKEKYLALVSENGNKIYDFRIKWDKTTSYPNFSRYFRKLEISAEAANQKIDLAKVKDSYTNKMEDNQPFSVSSFYAKPDRTVDLSEYVKMPNFEEILREYLPMARAKEDNQGRKFLQVTYGDESPKGSALVLINGEAIKDHSDLWKLDVNLIRKFDILYIANPQLTYFGDYLYGGLISVYTDENAFSVYDIEPITFDNPEAHLRYSNVKYQHQTDDPRFPLLKLNFFYDFAPSEKVYSFKAGDVDGHYHLNYFGFDENYNPFNQIKSIEVISN